MRQQERLEGRVQNIDEQLTKLESDKTLMKVQYSALIVYICRDTILNIISSLSSCEFHAVILSTHAVMKCLGTFVPCWKMKRKYNLFLAFNGWFIRVEIAFHKLLSSLTKKGNKTPQN